MFRKLRFFIGVGVMLFSGFMTAFLYYFAYSPETLFEGYYDDAARLQYFLDSGKSMLKEGLSPQEMTAANAVAAVEDHRLMERQSPFDLRAIARAIVTDIVQMRFAEGASTLQMQLAKLSFANPELRIDRSALGRVSAKLRQIRLTFALFDVKEQVILASYLAAFDCGLARFRGFDACSVYYFSKLPEEMTKKEAILLSISVRTPALLRKKPEVIMKRAEYVVTKMQELGWMSRAEALSLVNEPAPEVTYNIEHARAYAKNRLSPLAKAVIHGHQAGKEALAKRLQKLAPSSTKAYRSLVGLWEVIPEEAGRFHLKMHGFAGGVETMANVELEAGSWAKPFAGNMLRQRAGEEYLYSTIPKSVPVWDKNGKPYRPGDVGAEKLPAAAPVLEYLVRSSNTANISALAYSMIYMPANELRQGYRDLGLSKKDGGKFANAKWPVIQIASAYAGQDLSDYIDQSEYFGYGASMAVLLRWFHNEMSERVPALEIKNQVVSTILGAGVEAPFAGWMQGFADIWFDPKKKDYTRWARMMGQFSEKGTLRSVVAVFGKIPAKTHTASHNLGAAAGILLDDADTGARRMFVIGAVAFRTDGKPLDDGIYGTTLGAPAIIALMEDLEAQNLRLVEAE